MIFLVLCISVVAGEREKEQARLGYGIFSDSEKSFHCAEKFFSLLPVCVCESENENESEREH
jgi:hypothetical protein